MNADERAQNSARAMWSSDSASQALGMALGEVGEGRAVLSLTVQPRHCNGHGSCHGGIIFALADSAFAFACNSRNQRAVAQHAAITFIAPAKEGDVRTATAREVSVSGRNGLYDIAVTNQNHEQIAEFRGASRAVPGQHFEE